MPNLKITPEEEVIEKTRHFRLINLEDAFRSNPNARIINSESLFSKNGAEAYINAIYSSTDGDLAFVPSCECGQIRGEMRRGIICPNCGTECCSHFVDKLEQKAWINIPVEMGPVLHPIWYWMLEQLTRRGAGRTTGIPLIEILLKPDSAFRGKKRQVIVPPDFEPFILDNGKARGFKAFAENVDYYMDVLLNKYSRTAKKPIANGIRKMYELYKDCMFTTKLPILHNSLNPVTDNGATLKYIDESSANILEAVMDLSSEERKIKSGNRRRCTDGALFNIYSKILDYYSGIITDMGKKPGDIRKHAGGSRVNFGFRTVVHPHSEVMDTDEVVLPWGIMVNCFKPVILNFLMNKFNYTCNQALLAHRKALVTYDPIVDQCLQMYIDGTPKKKVPILLGRNPTLNYGSIILLYVKRYNKIPADETIGINARVVGPANIDFDGDELYGLWIFESKLEQDLSAAHPSQFILSTQNVGLSDSMGQLKQNWVLLENYLQEDPDIGVYEEL